MLCSCKKEAGDGGSSSIRGAVTKDVRIVLTNASTFQGSFPAADQEIYIVYGDNISPDDRIRTNFAGEFEFMYLRPGKYKVYTYSKDTNSVAVEWDEDHMTILREVEIEEKRQEQDIGELKIYDTQ
jgi:small nuclear ribonucleoprotein (snRNP)-like protein